MALSLLLLSVDRFTYDYHPRDTPPRLYWLFLLDFLWKTERTPPPLEENGGDGVIGASKRKAWGPLSRRMETTAPSVMRNLTVTEFCLS